MKVNWAEGAVGGLKKQSPGFSPHLVIPVSVCRKWLEERSVVVLAGKDLRKLLPADSPGP